MLPLLKKSTDNLVEVLGEKASSGESFDALKYVLISIYSSELTGGHKCSALLVVYLRNLQIKHYQYFSLV